MNNKLEDLVNILFAQAERFDDDEICRDAEAVENELKKAKAVAELSQQIIAVNRLQLDAVKIAMDYNLDSTELPSNLGIPIKRIEYVETKKMDR